MADAANTVGKILVQRGILAPEALEQAIRLKEQQGGSLAVNLVITGAIDDQTLAAFYEDRFDVPRVNEEDLAHVDREVFSLIPVEIVYDAGLFPLYRGGEDGDTLVVGIIDPSEPESLEEAAFFAALELQPRLMSIGQMARHYLRLTGKRWKVDWETVLARRRIRQAQLEAQKLADVPEDIELTDELRELFTQTEALDERLDRLFEQEEASEDVVVRLVNLEDGEPIDSGEVIELTRVKQTASSAMRPAKQAPARVIPKQQRKAIVAKARGENRWYLDPVEGGEAAVTKAASEGAASTKSPSIIIDESLLAEDPSAGEVIVLGADNIVALPEGDEDEDLDLEIEINMPDGDDEAESAHVPLRRAPQPPDPDPVPPIEVAAPAETEVPQRKSGGQATLVIDIPDDFDTSGVEPSDVEVDASYLSSDSQTPDFEEVEEPRVRDTLRIPMALERESAEEDDEPSEEAEPEIAPEVEPRDTVEELDTIVGGLAVGGHPETLEMPALQEPTTRRQDAPPTPPETPGRGYRDTHGSLDYRPSGETASDDAWLDESLEELMDTMEQERDAEEAQQKNADSLMQSVERALSGDDIAARNPSVDEEPAPVEEPEPLSTSAGSGAETSDANRNTLRGLPGLKLDELRRELLRPSAGLTFELDAGKDEIPEHLFEAIVALESATERDEVGRVALRHLSSVYERVVLFSLRGMSASVWLAENGSPQEMIIPEGGIHISAIACLARPVREHACYLGPVLDPGPVPDDDEALKGVNELRQMLGGEMPLSVIVAPLTIKGRQIALIYCDDGPGCAVTVDRVGLAHIRDAIEESLTRVILLRKSRPH